MGPHSENLLRDCGDFYLRRADGVFAYQLAVVVDDARMGVTEVVRGADLLSSTARQLYLYRLLGLTAPRFAHCPLLLASGWAAAVQAGRRPEPGEPAGKIHRCKRLSENWRTPTACRKNQPPAPRKASCRTFHGKKSPGTTSACRKDYFNDFEWPPRALWPCSAEKLLL